MDFVETVARDVLAELFELAAFADLSLGMEAERATMQKKGREAFSFSKQIRIDAKLALQSDSFSDRPKTEG